MNLCAAILPGIRAVWTVDSNSLPQHVAHKAAVGITVHVNSTLRSVPLASTPKAQRKSIADGATRYEEATLTLETSPDFNMQPRPAFVIEIADGRCFLMGTREGPELKVERTVTTGQPGGDRAVAAIEVKQKGLAALVPCTVQNKIHVDLS